MGHWVSRYYTDAEFSPDHHNPPTFDSHYGFQGERKERVMIATEAEMSSAKLETEDRGFCAHKLIEFKTCKSIKWPFVYRCHHEKHALAACEYEDYTIRLREYERERRLLQRKKRIMQKEERRAAEELAA